MTRFLLSLAESGFIPDVLIKIAARYISNKRLNEQSVDDNKDKIITVLSRGAVAEKTYDANEQHYEVPPEFFKYVLGTNLKYSCSLFNDVDSLDDAEESMLKLYMDRADIKDGHEVLDLGCGWGSFSLYVAERYPNINITSVSNSSDQIAYIKNEAHKKDLLNIKVFRMDVNNLELNKQFDRIVSIEMFEHLRNYKLILNSLNHALKPDGKLFIHIFCHKKLTYLYEMKNNLDWMTKYFFQGGIMPSKDIFQYFEGELEIINQWDINGNHYSKTCKAWLNNHYKNKKKILDIFEKHYDEPKIWFNRWRIFFLSCEAFFALNNGKEYFVGHYLFKKSN
ncbi:MAG: SAM-dependent methyltransferase [Gammaproteobacteria bacterium]|nr:SAM-dependent methyltransferase [Gammaproteobacteria bacterium]|tara:strand:- start:2640 stop:3650 length:1011 start_codon:yes stop_codon:yes gene_type:complete